MRDFCRNPKRKSPKQITFVPRQFQIREAEFEQTMKKLFKGSQKAWNTFLKPTINTLGPVTGMLVAANSKNPKVGQATANILKSITGGKFLAITDMHGQELGLKVM